MHPKDGKKVNDAQQSHIDQLKADHARQLLEAQISEIKSGKFVPKSIADIRLMDDVINSEEDEKTLFDKLFDRVFPPTEEEMGRFPDSDVEAEVKAMKYEGQEPAIEVEVEKVEPKEEKQSPADKVRMMKYEAHKEK